MPKLSQNSYDAVIIGAGIGGLVCGCYLAKAGMKVLIAEQHYKPGGYCTSFKRGRFTFDAAAHSIGGYEYGNTGKILKELKIDKKIKITRIDPSDVVITPDYQVSFWNDLDRTILEFQTVFPKEGHNIRDFFHHISGAEPNLLMSMRSKTFKDLLDKYFGDEKLKAILSFPLFGSGGLPHSRLSAFIGTKIFQEFILDGGYYPEGGIQAFSDSLAETFQELGGELRFSCFVKKIKVRNGSATGIELKNGDLLPAKYVISNCDARQTFFNLLGRDVIDPNLRVKLRKMIPSLSGFILYMATKEDSVNVPHCGSNVWYLFDYDIDKLYNSVRMSNFNSIKGFVLHAYPDKQRIFAFMNAPFKSKNFWEINKVRISSAFLSIIESRAIPELSRHLIYSEAATPHTLHRYTLNYKGAAFGWAATPSQLADPDFKKPSFLRNLYLTGHWTTHGLGIPGVVYIGHDVAASILRRKREFKNVN